MTQIAWVTLATAIAFAAVDWIAVAGAHRRLRWAFKPGTILLLVAVALSLHPTAETERYVFIAALLLSLAGDVLLLAGDRWFRVGLAAFLAAHLAYGAGFAIGGVNRGLLAYSGPAIAVVSLLLGGPILLSVLRSGSHAMAVAVTAYLLAISTMVALAAASGKPIAMTGAILFYTSDGLIAWNRFVRPLPWSPLPVIVTYHLGQVGLVLSLAS